MVKIETWTHDGKNDAAMITFEACNNDNFCCKTLLDKNLTKGAKDEFLMNEDFKQCWRSLDQKNLFMTGIDGWKPRVIGLQFVFQNGVLCKLSDQVQPGNDSRLPLLCNNHPGMWQRGYFFEYSNTNPNFLILYF